MLRRARKQARLDNRFRRQNELPAGGPGMFVRLADEYREDLGHIVVRNLVACGRALKRAPESYLIEVFDERGFGLFFWGYQQAALATMVALELGVHAEPADLDRYPSRLLLLTVNDSGVMVADDGERHLVPPW